MKQKSSNRLTDLLSPRHQEAHMNAGRSGQQQKNGRTTKQTRNNDTQMKTTLKIQNLTKSTNEMKPAIIQLNSKLNPDPPPAYTCTHSFLICTVFHTPSIPLHCGVVCVCVLALWRLDLVQSAVATISVGEQHSDLSAGWSGEIKWVSELRSTWEVKLCVWTKMRDSHKVVSTMK